METLSFNSEIHLLKVFAVTVLSIIGHVGRTFSDLGITQSA